MSLMCAIFLSISLNLSAQKVGFKVNLPYLATGTLNLATEVDVSRHMTFDLALSYNPFTIYPETNLKWKHYLIRPEFRYYFCERFYGHFIGLNAGYAHYNIGAVHIPTVEYSERYRYDGTLHTVGLSYGYTLVLSRRLNLETEVGVGWVTTDYDKFQCPKCGDKMEENVHKEFFAPTRAAISLVYMVR